MDLRSKLEVIGLKKHVIESIASNYIIEYHERINKIKNSHKLSEEILQLFNYITSDYNNSYNKIIIGDLYSRLYHYMTRFIEDLLANEDFWLNRKIIHKNIINDLLNELFNSSLNKCNNEMRKSIININADADADADANTKQ